MGVERCVGHAKKEGGNAFLFFCPEAAKWSAAWWSKDHGLLPLASLALRSPGLV